MRRARLLLFAVAGLLSAQDYDLILRNGKIVDGTGNPSFRGDVAIRNGRIVAVGKITGQAGRIIDASGLVVAPGFIDIHNHSDNTLIVDGRAEGMIRQGVATMILGEGESAAPSKAYPSFQQYFAKLVEQGISTNVASYVGSSQIWVEVHGRKAGPASKDEIAKMQQMVRDAMKQGALGVSSSLSGPPGAWIDTDTLVAMCTAAQPFGGIFSTHMRTEGFGVFESINEALEIGRRAKVPVDIIHLKIAEHKLWGRMNEVIATIEAARARGEQVQANVYPYRAGQNNLSAIVPPWAQDGGPAAMIARLHDPALRPRIEREIENGIPGSSWYNHYTATGSWEGMLLVSLSNPAYKKYEGQRMNQVIAAIQKKPLEVLFELLEANAGSVPTVYFHHSEDDMRYALKQPFVSIGSDGLAFRTEGPLSEGNPHPRSYGTFPRVLGRYVRDEKVLTLEDAVRKMTSANAAKIGIFDRGLLRPGMAADVTIFDETKIIDHATYEKPHQYATGVEYVIVNGGVVLDQGKHTGLKPGVPILGPGRK
jgi:N-acyl-D-amino-acid deacylase